ncbi:hypothetical protein M409DRAFT_28068 [Zasmidium cellare ATCC 36951]|uniref:Uncharacterized protein n=1 Tax=Zasmidium cellare ATCC 36951 TaxID=1080233 RepID=A0A6A6C3S4_ZASCE|nr:uncharacterized protein M409DRAFT_28068 [Zasmidium cellare ATCC 36951]KAF2161671.1 hypothetical protein M409DRAFT_28068 [Zasmidium cellare ATCC 36951]
MASEEALLEAEMARACRSGDLEIIDSVLDRSQKGRENLYLMTGFYHAIIGKQIEIIKYLSERGAFVDKGGNGRQGFLAINTTSLKLLNTLYDLGWRPNTVSLIYAVHHTDDDDVLRWLLDRGAQPNSWGGGLAMQGAVLANRFEAVDMLLAHGATFGKALHMAAQRPECFEMVKFLVSRGADVNSDGSLGTPLTFACSTANLEAASWLLEHGAVTSSVTSSNKFGRELHLAEARLRSAKELDAGEGSDEVPTRDEQAVSGF